jgi:predicted Zn-dependent protease
VTLRLRKPGDALRYVQPLLAYDPNNTQAVMLGVASLTALGRHSEAHAALAARKRFPDNPAVQLQTALLAIAQKKYKEAEAFLWKIYVPGQTDPRPGVALANIYAAQQQWEKAIQFLQEDVKKSPSSPTIRSPRILMLSNPKAL